MRLRISGRPKGSQNSAASLTSFDVSSFVEIRTRFEDRILKERNIQLEIMSMFSRASVLALKEIPAANASIEGDYRDYVDLSVAVATPKGLMMIVLRNAEAIGFLDIEKGIAELGRQVRT